MAKKSENHSQLGYKCTGNKNTRRFTYGVLKIIHSDSEITIEVFTQIIPPVLFLFEPKVKITANTLFYTLICTDT